MTLRSDPVCDRGGKPRIVNADLKRAVPFTHAGHRQRRRGAGEPSGEDHRRRITIERRLNHSRVLVPRAYTCPLISMPRNRPVCLVGSFAGCAMIFAGFPAFTTCGVTPDASTEATGASSNVQLSVLPLSPSTGTSIVMYTCGLAHLTVVMTPSAVMVFSSSYTWCEWCAQAGAATAMSATVAAKNDFRNIPCSSEWMNP